MSYPESLRDRTGQGEAYPIGRAALDSALSAAGVAKLDKIYFLRAGIEEWRESGVGDVMGITFVAAIAGRRSRTDIRIHAVPVGFKHVVKIALTKALADAAAWIHRAESSENVWRSTDHALVLRWDGADLRRDER